MTTTTTPDATTRRFGKCFYCRYRVVIDTAAANVEFDERVNAARVDGVVVCCPNDHRDQQWGPAAGRSVIVFHHGVRGKLNPAIRCTARCLAAKTADCECSCGGMHHGETAAG